jgi:hypothetical protein
LLSTLIWTSDGEIIDESVQINGAVDDDMLRLSIAMYVPSDQMALDERRSLDSSRNYPPTTAMKRPAHFVS